MNFIRTCYGRAINSNQIDELFIEDILLNDETIGLRISCMINYEKIIISHVMTYGEAGQIFNIGNDRKFSDFLNDDMCRVLQPILDKLIVQNENEDIDSYYSRLEEERDRIIEDLVFVETDW